MRLTLIVVALLILSCCIPSPSQVAAPPADATQQHLRAAQRSMQQKRPDLAIPEFEAAIALSPANVDAQANLGVLLYFKGDYAKAAPHLRVAVQAKADLWKIQALLGLAEFRLHDVSTARPDLEAALPHLKGEKVQSEVGDALIVIDSASGDLDKAASAVQVLLESHPTDEQLLLTSYRLYSDLASNAILTLAISAPHSAEMHQVMARELIRHGDEAAAVANYREAIKINPKLPGLYYELGSTLYNSTDENLQSEAEAQFKSALEVNPNDEKALLMLGKVAARRGDMDAAFTTDSRAVAMQPDDAEACSELAKILITRNELDKARLLLKHAIEIDPLDYTAHYRLSTIARQQGKPEEAKAELAAYKKNKEMKDKLRGLFHDMRVRLDDKPEDEREMAK